MKLFSNLRGPALDGNVEKFVLSHTLPRLKTFISWSYPRPKLTVQFVYM